ncbi:MAG: 1-deoxy-D-xylulose-5-phosphate synthase, partial [Lachnospiraceae bacterium]|nr:1-deoxy-D-xylulose-5-phosphate synthase [Lachnospiraceae bacterium]
KSLEDFLNTIPVAGPKIVTKLKRSKDSIKQLFVPGMLFENMGITYIGPIDGHNIDHMLQAFEAASQSDGPVLVHVVTKKGKGYSFAQNNPAKYHGVGPFDVGTGKPMKKCGTSYTDIFGKRIYSYAKGDTRIVAVCAAMADGTGLTDFAKEFKDRFFDVGIAEEHAVTFAAGLATQGFIPFVAIYSTFLQRAYDQIVHDVCKNRLHVIFAVDRAGIVGQDGETHQGIFDVSYLSGIPQMVLMAPKNGKELERMLDFALDYDGPVAIRYPRGEASLALEDRDAPIELGKSEVICEDGSDVVFFAFGNMVETAFEVSRRLKEQGIGSTVINMRFAAPFDREALKKYSESAGLVVSMEENVRRGGLGQAIAAYLSEEGVALKSFIDVSLPDTYLCQGRPDELKKANHTDAEGVLAQVLEKLHKIKSETN